MQLRSGIGPARVERLGQLVPRAMRSALHVRTGLEHTRILALEKVDPAGDAPPAFFQVDAALTRR